MNNKFFQVIGFLKGKPESVIISDQAEPVLDEFNSLRDEGSDKYDVIEFWSKGRRRKRIVFMDNKVVRFDPTEAAKVLLDAQPSKKESEAPEAPEAPETPDGGTESEEDTEEGQESASDEVDSILDSIDITSAAKKLAEDHLIDITKIVGTGTDGKIIKSDVEKIL